MTYHFSKTLKTSFQDALERTKEALKKEGFGVLTEIDVKATLKEKLNIDFRPYQIIGACNPPLAYRAIQAEDKIGLMLPCNVIVQELESGNVEVAAFDPIVVMAAVGNPDLKNVGQEVQMKLETVIRSL
jgi:uncharacterized protein (DUF302 family)